MKLVEYTTKNLYGEFKPEEICFVVEKDYDHIDELSHITDDLNDALDEAKENDYKIFVFEKKFAKDCLYTDRIFQDMLENLEDEGLNIGYAIGGIEEEAEEDFAKLINKWFEKYVGNNYWFTDRLLGTLRLD